jgi:hypothetical protein
MPSPIVNKTIVVTAKKVPGLRRLPMLRLLALGDVALLAKLHYEKLEPRERRRLVVLLREGRGRPGNLSAHQRAELERLITKLEPWLFAGAAAGRLSPMPLPRRITQGRKRR